MDSIDLKLHNILLHEVYLLHYFHERVFNKYSLIKALSLEHKVALSPALSINFVNSCWV